MYFGIVSSESIEKTVCYSTWRNKCPFLFGTLDSPPTTERGQEPDRGPGSGRGVWISGLRLSARPLLAGALAAAVHAQAQAADGVAREAQGPVPALRLPARGAGDRGALSDPARLGELL